MTVSGSASEVFWRAFMELPKKERKMVIKRMLGDRKFMEDMLGIILDKCNGSS